MGLLQKSQPYHSLVIPMSPFLFFQHAYLQQQPAVELSALHSDMKSSGCAAAN